MFTGKVYVFLVVAVVMVVVAAYSINIAQAQQKPQIIFPVAGTSWVIAPGTPIYNPYSPTTIAGCSIVGAMTYLPLAFYNSMTNSYLPVLADNWTIQVLPNGSGILTVHLRPGFYWFNGSATIPFTAWDAYARFYIGIKAFGWYRPYMLPQYADEDVRVIDNYTIQFLFQKWTALRLYYVLTTCMSTPWPVWEPIVNELKAMNTTQAIKFSDNITKFVVPYWGLFPYYLTYFSSNYMLITLEPSNLLSDWFRIFPLADWYYYDPTYEAIWGSNTVALESYLAGKGTWGSAGFSMQQVEVLEQHGIGIYFGPSFFTMGIAVNPHYYPWNIPQVREALCYVINRTETAEAWGLAISHPDYYPEPVVPEVIDTYPPDVRQFIIPCSYNWTKASQMLQSLGFKKINGYWYTPNGTQLALTVIAPAGWTDWDTMAQDAVEQLDAFGINAKLLTIDVGTFWSVTLPNAEYEALINGIANAPSYSTMWIWTNWPWWEEGRAISAGVSGSDAWPFQWPNGTCSPVIVPTTPNIPNGTIVWCVNSTFGYINLTNWQSFVTQYSPGEPEYDLALEVIFAWMHYFVPIVPLYDKYWPFEYSTSIMDPGWLFQGYVYDNYPGLLAVFLEYQPWGYGNQPFSVNTWGLFAPKGIVPPVAQAIANGSIWTKYPQYAAFLGIPTPDPMLQEAVASYFHIPYTPVTTTTSTTTTTTTTTTPVTTTSTTTSTITTTATTTTTAVSTVTSTATVTSTVTTTSTTTTTAVSTVTVTKPVISTALVIGIVVIVIVIAAVAAIIALRRR